MNTSSSPQVAEIVTFRLKGGVADDAFAAAAADTQTLLSQAPGFQRRFLSRGDDGRWSDVVLWDNMETALSAADNVVKHPDFQLFGNMIDGPSVEMRHEHVAVEMT